MALKRAFSDEEKYGLTEEEIKLGEKYLRKHKTAGAIDEVESMKLYEMYMVGCSFYEIHQQFPRHPVDQIILTAALRGWPRDRDKMMSSLRDRVQAKVVKSVIEQVDFLTTMLSVASAEHMEAMKKFVIDPDKNPLPSIRVQNIKEYKEVVETLHKLVAGATGTAKNSKSSAMFEALEPSKQSKPLGSRDQENGDESAADFIASEIVD
jgi:aromatic ring hydroxylase